MMEKQIAYVRNKMVGLILAIAVVTAWQWDFIIEGVTAHVWTTGSILSAFAFSIVMAFVFVHKLKNEVIAFNALKEMWDDIRIGPTEQATDPLWRHYRCSRPGRVFRRPRLLGHAYDLVTEELARTKKIKISVETMNTLVHKISQTIDDEKSLLGYMSGLLVFMGLIGTFIGLLHMVGSMGGIIGQLASSAGGSAGPDAFQKLLGALQEPLKGMASGFAASLFGLFSSLVVGLLGRMAGQAAGVLKHGFESWLAGVVQIGSEEDEAPEVVKVYGAAVDGSLVQAVGRVLTDYSRAAATFDHAVRILRDIQIGQNQQGKLMESMVQALSRVGGGLEAVTTGVSETVSAELSEMRTLIRDAERMRSDAAIVDRLQSSFSNSADGHSSAYGLTANQGELTVSEQMKRVEAALPQFGGRDPGVADQLDRLNANVSQTFSDYSDNLKRAVAAFEDANGHLASGNDLDAVWKSRRRDGHDGDVEVGAL